MKTINSLHCYLSWTHLTVTLTTSHPHPQPEGETFLTLLPSHLYGFSGEVFIWKWNVLLKYYITFSHQYKDHYTHFTELS